MANFSKNSYTISTSASPAEGGTTTGGGTYQHGASVTVTATTSAGYEFVNWTENGSPVSTSASYPFTVTGNRNLVANFSKKSYTISTSASPAAGGTTAGNGTYNYGSTVTVTATPSTGYEFVNWTENGSPVYTSAIYQFTVTGNRTLVANFSQQVGSLQVTISPQGAIDAGAKWQVDGGTPQSSGTKVDNLAVGAHTVSFSDVTGWAKPGNQTITINNGQTTTASGTYTQQVGSLQVTISPQGAIDAEAKWLVDGGAPQSSGTTVSGLSVGSHTVSFSDVTGWAKPGHTITINNGQTTTASGVYTQQVGSLQVTISPQGAIDAGAKWLVDGGAPQSSGTTVSGLSVGSHTVSFSDVTGWAKPGNQTITINNGQTTDCQRNLYPAGRFITGDHQPAGGN